MPAKSDNCKYTLAPQKNTFYNKQKGKKSAPVWNESYILSVMIALKQTQESSVTLSSVFFIWSEFLSTSISL